MESILHLPIRLGHGIELWLATVAMGQTWRFDGVAVNGVLSSDGVRGGPASVEWLGDNKTLLVRLVPGGRGAPPSIPAIPKGPHVQESLGHAGPAPTFEDLLATPHDEDLFDYYATAQLAYLDSVSGKVSPLGNPGIYTIVRPSPDEKHLLTGRLHRPYSYQLPAGSFPQDVQVWDRAAKVEYSIARLPLAERVPIAGVRTGPRSYDWMNRKTASLTWVEALDGGNPVEQVPFRGRILSHAAPFQGEPVEIAKVKERFAGMQPLDNGKALVEDYERKSRVVRTLEFDLDKPGSEAKVVFSRNEGDAYRDPGSPFSRVLPTGHRGVIQTGDDILLSGPGSSPAGDRPFVDRFNLATGKAQRLFQADAGGYEGIEAVLDDNGTRLLTRRESPTELPNYFVRNRAELKQLTNFANPVPQTAGIRKQLVNYKRADGVPLSFTLYLPADYKQGTRLPALLRAYPYKFFMSSL